MPEEDWIEHTVSPGIDWVRGVGFESGVQVLPPDFNLIVKVYHEYI